MTNQYQPTEHETGIRQLWEEGGLFRLPPTTTDDRPTFSLIFPPPNANGSLHIGHLVGVAIQDSLARYYRMNGYRVLWLPGYDHAGFETQVVFDKVLEKAGRNRFELEPQALYNEMYEFTTGHIDKVRAQLKTLGASLDFDHEIFTLDPRVVSAVQANFKRLADDGLVYRGTRSVSWCVKHQTTLAELEIRSIPTTLSLYYLQYGPLVVATTRPEDVMAVVALAVHPTDPRYQSYIGQTVTVETLFGQRQLPVIADEFVKPEFGTGVVKVSPAHDPNDFEMALRHNLPTDQSVIDQYGKLTAINGRFAGLKVLAGRLAMVEAMQEAGLLVKTDPNYATTQSCCYKCQQPVEPRVMPQWFIAMTKTGQSGKNLRDDAVEAVRSGQIRFLNSKYENQYYSWLTNLRDWNISHQIHWGIRLPVWYCQNKASQCAPIITAGEAPANCPHCQGNALVQDSDVFNTWFSSGQWPFLALTTQGLDSFYPTTIIETAYDILFFWVARMIMLGLYFTDQPPFREVYIHGLVRDQDRQKMSKSKGNVIDPLGVASQYGTDATRLALLFGVAGGNDIVISEDKIKGMRNFANKLWNMAKFIEWRAAELWPELEAEALKQKLAEFELTATGVSTAAAN
ncbi:MAG: valyl-tRNA synthetase, partial [Candidatus Berkelbacteria bacterium Gr01-1014_85]